MSMTLQDAREFLLWCTVLNYAALAAWFVIFVSARPWLRKLHGRWFQMSDERFDSIHYAGMAVYKVGIHLLCLMPYLALCIVG